MTQQGKRQTSARALSGFSTVTNYNEDFLRLFDRDGIAAGTFNERQLQWINARMGASYTNLNDAMQAYATSQSAFNWSSLGELNETVNLTKAMPSGATYTRSGATATGLTVAGALLPFAADTPQRTDRGLTLEPARTNKVTIFNANPTSTTGLIKSGDAAAVLSLVSDAAALATAGLSGVVTGGQVFRLNNTLGAAVAQVRVPGSTGNTNPHKYFAYARSTGAAFIGVSSTNSVNVAVSTGGYLRAVTTRAVPTLSEDIRMTANAGSDLYFILPELIEGTDTTSPIITVGAAATRGLPVFTESVPAGRTKALLTYADATTTLVTGLTPGGTVDVATTVIAAGKGAFGASELASRVWQA